MDKLECFENINCYWMEGEHKNCINNEKQFNLIYIIDTQLLSLLNHFVQFDTIYNNYSQIIYFGNNQSLTSNQISRTKKVNNFFQALNFINVYIQNPIIIIINGQNKLGQQQKLRSIKQYLDSHGI